MSLWVLSPRQKYELKQINNPTTAKQSDTFVFGKPIKHQQNQHAAQPMQLTRFLLPLLDIIFEPKLSIGVQGPQSMKRNYCINFVKYLSLVMSFQKLRNSVSNSCKKKTIIIYYI